MTTRELHFRIQERFENLAATASHMSGEQPSQLEIDLLLSKLRETYDEVLYLKRIALQQFVREAPRRAEQLKPIAERQPEAMPLTDVEEPDPSVDDVFTMIETAIDETNQPNKEIVSKPAKSSLPEVNEVIESIAQSPKQPQQEAPAKSVVNSAESAKASETAAKASQTETQTSISESITEAIQVTQSAQINQKPVAPVKKEAPEIKQEAKPTAAPSKSVHDMLHNYQGAKLQPKAVKNLGAAIGLNDKFQFIRELFGSSSDTFNATIESLNKMESFDDAHAYLKQQYDWDETDPIVVKFLEMVNRRYL